MNGLKSSKCQNYISVTVRQTKGSKSSALLSGLADHGPDTSERDFARYVVSWMERGLHRWIIRPGSWGPEYIGKTVNQSRV